MHPHHFALPIQDSHSTTTYSTRSPHSSLSMSQPTVFAPALGHQFPQPYNFPPYFANNVPLVVPPFPMPGPWSAPVVFPSYRHAQQPPSPTQTRRMSAYTIGGSYNVPTAGKLSKKQRKALRRALAIQTETITQPGPSTALAAIPVDVQQSPDRLFSPCDEPRPTVEPQFHTMSGARPQSPATLTVKLERNHTASPELVSTPSIEMLRRESPIKARGTGGKTQPDISALCTLPFSVLACFAKLRLHFQCQSTPCLMRPPLCATR
jgi:hypothetical protein